MLKKLLLLSSVFVATALSFAADITQLSAADAAALVRKGQAVLVDVREPAEWKETGVAQPAVLLEKSDFDGAKAAWAPFLAKTPKDKTVILYCRSGKRAGVLAEALAAQGYRVANAGGMKDWTDAGLPVRQFDGHP
ncbi:MAG: sulfurtransferase [Opitutus sp.]|nr:sulfurtransferase [Opitutus sp.]